MAVEPAHGARPKARDDALVVERVDDELLIYDLERDEAHCLNETAALVFEHCDGERTVEELAELVPDEDVVRAALGRLSKARLLDEPAAADRWSRRQVLRKVGVAGAVAGIGLPVVRSIVAPTPAAALVTCVRVPGGCGPFNTDLFLCTAPTACPPPSFCSQTPDCACECPP